MDMNLNEKLVTAVMAHIPKKIKPGSYLMETLHLSRESAYRRLRSEIPFSMDEIGVLSIKLGFSVDEIIGEMKQNRAVFDFFSEEDSFSFVYYLMLQKCCAEIENVQNSRSIETILALNRTMPILRVFFDNIFKFTFYTWFQQNCGTSSNQPFSEIVIPEEIVLIQRRLQMLLKKFDTATLILDPNIFLSLLKDIQYFYQRKLINDAELSVLREEVLMQIEMFEKVAQTGFFGSGTKINLYLSPLYINANIVHFNFDNTQKSLFWIHTANPIIIHNQNICSINLKWINFLKRQSTLISESNEILQAEFFEQQRIFVNQNMTNI